MCVFVVLVAKRYSSRFIENLWRSPLESLRIVPASLGTGGLSSQCSR